MTTLAVRARPPAGRDPRLLSPHGRDRPLVSCAFAARGAAPGRADQGESVFLDFVDAMRRGLAAALPLDGVYLASHGASSATGGRGDERRRAPSRR